MENKENKTCTEESLEVCFIKCEWELNPDSSGCYLWRIELG